MAHPGPPHGPSLHIYETKQRSPNECWLMTLSVESSSSDKGKVHVSKQKLHQFYYNIIIYYLFFK
jgi:hypothetical protein